VASTSSSETHQYSNTATGSNSSNSSSPINSSVVLSDLQELSVIGSGSSGVVKKVLHRPTQQVRLITNIAGTETLPGTSLRASWAHGGSQFWHPSSPYIYKHGFAASGCMDALSQCQQWSQLLHGTTETTPCITAALLQWPRVVISCHQASKSCGERLNHASTEAAAMIPPACSCEPCTLCPCNDRCVNWGRCMRPCVYVQVYVLKVINLDMGNQQVRRQVTREVRALDGARHPHVVSYHQSFFAEGAVTILMEFMDGGTLWDLLQKVSGMTALFVLLHACRSGRCLE